MKAGFFHCPFSFLIKKVIFRPRNSRETIKFIIMNNKKKFQLYESLSGEENLFADEKLLKKVKPGARVFKRHSVFPVQHQKEILWELINAGTTEEEILNNRKTGKKAGSAKVVAKKAPAEKARAGKTPVKTKKAATDAEKKS